MAKLTKPFNEVGPGKPSKINQEKKNETKKRTVQQYRPFENEHLDSLWRSTVYKYHMGGSKNALEEAERDVRQYAMDVYQSDKLGAKDPLGAAQRRLDLTSEQNLFNYKTKGATDYASLKAIWDAEGFVRKQPHQGTEAENQANYDFYTNLIDYLQLASHKGYDALPENIRDAFDKSKFGQFTGWHADMPQEEWDALNAWGDEMAKQYKPYTTSRFQDHLWEKMIQTPEGAQAWLDEAMGTEEEQEAWDNNWQVSRNAKYGEMEEEVQKQLSQFQRPEGGAQEFALPEKFRNDPEYSFVNGVDTGANRLFMKAAGLEFHYDDYERLVYNSLYGEGTEEEKKAANDYLQWLKYRKGQQMQTLAVTGAQVLASQDLVAGSLLHWAENPFRSIGAVDITLQAARNAINPEQRRPIYTHGAGNISGAVADAAIQQVMEDINWNVNIFGHEVDLADKIYGAFMNTADSLTTSLLAKAFGVGSPKLAESLSKIFIGSQAAQSAMMDAQERKGNDGQIILSGAFSGAAEAIFERWSLGKFWDSAAKTKSGDWKALLLDVFAQMGINGSEELFTEAANILSDDFAMGEKSKAKQAYDYYRDMGLDDKQAKSKLAADLGLQLEQAFEGGAWQGLLMSGVSNTASGTRQHSENKRVGKAIIAGETETQILEKAKAFGPDSLSAKSAQKYEKKKTPEGLGKVFRDTLNTMDQRGRRELYDLTFGQVKMALNADGEIANVDAVATAIVDLYAGNRLDADEMQALAESKKGMDVAQELLGMDMLTMTALEDAGKAEKKGAAPVGELPKAVQAPEGMTQQEAQEAPEMPAQQSVEVTGADGSTTEIAGIREDDDGQAVIETADGNEIDLEDAGLTESQQQIANEARGTEYAAQILGAYTEAESMTTNARDFSRGFNRVAAAAANGKTLEEATKGIYAGKLSEAAKQAAYEAGQRARAQMAAQQSSATYKAAQRDGFRMLTADIGSKAGLYYANVTGKVTDAAKTMMRVIERFAEEAGIQIQVFDTQGKANGAYTQGTNVIRLALDADQGALTKVASHEVYHYIKDWNSDGADRLAKKVFEYLEKADGYNLDQRVQEKIQEYARANVTLDPDAAKEEIVADALLDFIGTEENFRAILSEDSKLAEKIRAWVQQMMARIRSILETMAASNPEVRVLKDNAQYMAEIAEMMDGILEETREIMESTKKGESARIKNDPAVTEYRDDMRTAKDKSERQYALNGLMAEAFARTQKEWLQKHPDADMDSAIAEFTEALSAYGRGEKFVQKALEDAGFISPTPGSNEMALLSFAGQQAAMMQERGEKGKVKYSFQGIDQETGLKKYRIDFGVGLSKEQKQTELVKLIRNVWANNPITLSVVDGNEKRTITAQFDPDFDPQGMRRTDIGKIVYGNRMGSAKDRRITMGLSGDMYQIISDAEYLTQEAEQGKESETHDGVKKWYYFATDIIVEELTGETAPYTVFIDVKEKDSGDFVYTYYALNEEKSAKLRSSDTTAHRSKTEVNSDKAIAAAVGALGFSGPSEVKNTSVNYNIAQNSETVKSQEEEFSDKNTKYSIRKEAPPKNTIKGYKVFVVFKNKPGKLYPPMVANPGGESTPVGVWLNADVGAQAPDSKTGRKQVKAGGKGTQGGSGSLAFRPGWHLGDMPKATQFNRLNPETGVKELFPENFVWAECECAADHDYQEEAMSYGYNANGKFQHSLAGLPRLPREEDGTAGYYRYRTNPNPDTVPWIITGAMKVNRILDDAETEAILRENGIEPMKRVGGPIDLEKYGLKAGDVKESKFSLKESPTAPVEEGIKEDAELYTQMRQSAEGKAALKILQKLYGMATRGDSYLMAGEKEALIEKGAWQKRMPEIMEKIKAETGSEINERKLRSDLAAIFNAMDRGEDVSDMLLAAKDLGRDILAEAPGMMNPIDPGVKEAMRILKDSRFYLTDEMKSEIRNTQYGSVAAYMRKNFGKMGIRAKAKDGKGGARTSLAEVWMELNEILPGTFQADATEADMPGIVDAWLETAGQRDFGGAFGQNIGAYSTDLGLSIMLEYFNLPGALETAKKTKGEINFEVYRQTEDAREKFENEITAFKAKQERMRMEHQQKYEEKIATLQAKLEYGKAREDLTKEIQSDVKYLNNRLAKATNTSHVPENMRQIVIKTINPFLHSTSVFNGKTVSMLREEYEKLATEQVNAETEAARMYNVNVLDSIKNMEKTVDGKLLTDLTLQQLWDVRDVMANIKGMVERANEMFTEGRNENYKALGDEEVIDLAEKETIKNEKVMAVAFKNMTPPYFFKRIGGVFGRMWNDFRDGQDKWAKWMRDARTFADKMIKDYGMDKWLNGKETLRFTTKRGETIELNRQLALSLYATWQREIRNTMQNANHLRMGGFRYPKGMKTYEGVDMKRPHALTSVDMLHIQDFLGKNAMEFADKMVGYLSNDMARIGNEVSMQLYNIKTFKEKYYFPYQSSSDFLSQDLTKGDIALEDASGALKNWGATKKLQTKANNPVVIGDFMDIWAGHVNKMCIYGAFTIPADNMNRLYNYKTPVDSDMTPTSVKQELSRVYGDGAGKYIATLIRDISGGVRAQDRTSVGKMVSKFKKGSVAGNLQVVIQQPSAIARVMAVMNPKYLMMPPGDIKKNIQEMREHSGIAFIKEMGRFDTGTGLSAVEWLQESVQEGSIIKRGMERIDKFTGWGAEKADLLTWQHIWHAVKKEVEAKAPELEVGSREYFEAVTQRFEEIIDYTQVYDSVLAKSELMRSNSTFDKMTTSFMAEPTVTYNMLQDAIMNVKEMGGKKKLLRATSVWVIATAFNAMLKSLVSAMRRKDDEERTYIEKYIAEVWGNFSGDMDPISLIPIGRDIASLLDGYDVERADMAIYAQMVDAWNILWNDKKSFMDKIQAVTGAAGNMLGIPAKNIWRDGEALLNAIMANPDGGTEWRDIKYSVLDETPAILGQIQIWDDAATAYYARMARALDAGDVDKYTEFKEYMTGAEKKTEQTIKTGVIKQIKEMYLDGEMDRESAEKILMEHFEMKEKDAYFQVEEWIAKEEDPDASYSRMGEWIEAVESGTDLAKVWQKYKKLGYDKGDLSSAITTEYKPQYIELMKTNPTAAANMKAKLLTALSAIGYDRTKKAKDIDAWLK